MAVKVFLHDINRAYYRGNPPENFEIEVNYSICLSSGLPPNDDPHTEEGAMVLQFPVTSGPNEVFQKAWEEVVNICTANSWEVPVKADVYSWIPLDFSTILPD